MKYQNILRILCIITIIFILFLVVTKENFGCDFSPIGESLDKCKALCTNAGCQDCETKCKNCNDPKQCKWLDQNMCTFIPKGTSNMTCVDECLSDKKVRWGGDLCTFDKCKKICGNCKDPKMCVWLNKPKEECKFIPWGDTNQSCVDRCVSDDRSNWGGDACTNKKCKVICDSCTDKETCKWNMNKFVETNISESNIPPAQFIRGIPGRDSIYIEWYRIQNDDFPIKSYLIYYFKSYKPFEGMKIISYTSEDKSCNYTIENLIPGEDYTVSIVALNVRGQGPRSNLLDFKVDLNNIIINPQLQ